MQSPLLLRCLCALLGLIIMAALPAWGQENDDLSTEAPGMAIIDVAPEGASDEDQEPRYLRPVSETADLNLLTQIFGNIARAASGQISLEDALGQTAQNEANESPHTDSVIAAMMRVFLLGIIAVVSIAMLLMVLVYLVSAGIDGEIINKRYNEWVAIRVAYSIIMMLPILGGWSLGQYGILNAAFFVNGITNEMHKVGNRWVYANNAVGSMPIQGHRYKSLIENIYLAELCSAVGNWHFEQRFKYANSELEIIDERLSSEKFTTKTKKALEKQREVLQKYVTEFSEDKYLYATSTIGNQGKTETPKSQFTMSHHPGASYYQSPRSDKYTMRHGWGSPSTAEDSCGQVSFELEMAGNDSGSAGELASKGERNKAFLEAYFEAHDAATAATITRIGQQIQGGKDTIMAALADIPMQDKSQRSEAIETLATQDAVIQALGGALHPQGKIEQLTWDGLIQGETAQYVTLIRTEYQLGTEKALDDFAAQLARLHQQQRSGDLTPYDQALTQEGEDKPIDDYHFLVENTAKGWMYAGFKWWDLSRATQFNLQLAQQLPTYTPFVSHLDAHSEEVATKLTTLAQQYQTYRGMRRISDTNPTLGNEDPTTPEYINKWAHEFETDPDGGWRRYKSKLSEWMAETILTDFLFDFKNRDLLATLSNTGHNFLVAGEAMLVTAGVAGIGSAITGAAQSGPGATKAVGAIADTFVSGAAKILLWGGVILMVAGFVLAIYMPLLPAIIWTFGIIGWLEKLIGLMLSFGMWMAGHLVPDGDGLINGVGRQGYIHLASVLARPPALLLSLHFSMIALGAIGFFLSDFATSFMVNASRGNFVGPVVLLGNIVVFTGFIVVVAHMILAWIYKISDDLPQYIGGSIGQFGEGEGRHHIQAVGGVVHSKVEGAAHGASAGGKAGGRPGGGQGGGQGSAGNPNRATRQATKNEDYT